MLDLCLHNVNVRLIGNGGGLVYAPLGPTHLAIEDLAILRAIPNMTVVVPADADEMRRLMPLTVDYRDPIYRLAKGNDPIVTTVKRGDHVVLHWRPSDGLQSETPVYRWNGGKVNAGWVTTFNEYAVVSENRLTPIPRTLI